MKKTFSEPKVLLVQLDAYDVMTSSPTSLQVMSDDYDTGDAAKGNRRDTPWEGSPWDD